MENCLTRFDVLMSLNVNMHDDHWADLSACIVIDEVSLEIKEMLGRERKFLFWNGANVSCSVDF